MKENDLGQELVKQMNEEHGGKSTPDIKSAEEIVVEEENRIQHLKRMTKITWRFAIYYLPLMYFCLIVLPEKPYLLLLPILEYVFIACAITYTIKLYLASRAANWRQVQNSLANIEAILKESSKSE